MAGRARQLGVALRPHAKTHKCVELGKLQLQHGARGLTVATLVEAEAFARAGVTDLTLGVPDRSDARRTRASHRAGDRRNPARRGRRPRCGAGARGLGTARLAQGGLRLSPRRRGSGVAVRHRGGARARPGAGARVRRDPEPLRSRVPHAEQSGSGRRRRERAQRDGGIRRAARQSGHRDPRRERRVDAGDGGGHRSYGRHRGATGQLRVLRPDDGADRVLRAGRRGSQCARDGGVAPAGRVSLRRGRGSARALQGHGADARGTSGDGRGERRSGPDRGDAVARARPDPSRIRGEPRRPLQGRRQSRDHSQPFLPHGRALRRISRHTWDGERGRGTGGVPVEGRAGTMSAPPQAVTALAWALAGPPILIYGATRIRRGRIALHVTLMSVSAVIEIAVVVGVSFLMAPSPRRAALVALPFFKIHLAFAVAALAGLLWQLTSRAVARLRPLHRHTGPYVVLVWCLALLTGIYNYIFLYVMGSP